MATKPKVTVAQYIEQQIALSDKSQKEIAAEVGYEKPNVITMIKQGHTKLPLSKVGLFARALGVDSRHLLRLTLNEYMPEVWNVLEQIMGKELVSEEEVALVKLARDASGGVPLDLSSADNKKKLVAVLQEIASKELKDREGAAKAVAALPRNARK